MPEGKLGFPRFSEAGPLVESDGNKIRDEKITNSTSSFVAPEIIRFLDAIEGESIRRVTSREFPRLEERPREGITAMYFVSDNEVIVSPREIIHADYAAELPKEKFTQQLIIPFSSVKTTSSKVADQGWFLDVPASAGSMMIRSETTELNEELVMSSKARRPGDIWPAVYTAYLTDHPFSTTVTFNYQRKSSKFRISEGYKELIFTTGELPSPIINRVESMQQKR